LRVRFAVASLQRTGCDARALSAVSGLRSLWRPDSRGNEENQLRRLPVPARDYPAGIWLYLRFSSSLRDVEDLLAERGISVSYETVRRWVNHFGPMIAADLRKRRPKPHTTWQLDEAYLKIDGRMVYLWRAVATRRSAFRGIRLRIRAL